MCLSKGQVVSRRLPLSEDDIAYDIGPETLLNYRTLVKAPAFLQGTMGYYEKKPFDLGSASMANAVLDV